MKKYALVDESGTVFNLISWDGDAASWQAPDGTQAIEIGDDEFVTIGSTYDTGSGFSHNEPPTEPARIESVTMRQARLALLAAGRLADVGAAIEALPSPDKDAARIEWDYAATVDRSSPFTQQLAGALDLDDAALDKLFTQAAAL